MRRKYCNKVPERHFGLGTTSSFVILFLCFGFCHCTNTEAPDVEGFGEISFLANADTAGSMCTQLLPGLRKLQLGVDITKLDLLPLKFSNSDGFKYPVIDFNCSRKKTRTIAGTVYNVPDEIALIVSKSGGFLNAEVSILKKSSDVLKKMSADIGLGSLTKGLFSASASYKRMTSNFYNESRYVERIVSHQSGFSVILKPDFALNLGEDAQLFIDEYLPSKFETNPGQYFKFIEYFGTHYFSSANYGGILQLYLETRKSYYQGKSDREVKAEASATFFNILKASGGYSRSVKKVDTKFTSDTNQIIRYYGGDTNLLASGGLSKWQPTVAKNPWLFSGKLRAISDLIKDPSKKESMKKATQIYIDVAYLNFLQGLLNSAYNKYPSFSAQISNYVKQVQSLQAAKEKDHNAIVNLGAKLEEELEMPSWFLNQVELCYRWRPDGDGGQCGGGVGRYLCAKPGSMTTYYRDDTDGRGGGCRMQWQIKKQGSLTQKWLQDTKICYQWWPDGDGGQCGGGAARHLCASINKFTSEYRDDTDGRGGGCRMQWRLVVPASAPIWYRSMKLCYQWYADGDGGQCTAPSQLLCATTNSWTTAYRDDTDGRGGGCRMRWGIVPS